MHAPPHHAGPRRRCPLGFGRFRLRRDAHLLDRHDARCPGHLPAQPDARERVKWVRGAQCNGTGRLAQRGDADARRRVQCPAAGESGCRRTDADIHRYEYRQELLPVDGSARRRQQRQGRSRMGYVHGQRERRPRDQSSGAASDRGQYDREPGDRSVRRNRFA